ncbi:MAG: lysyl-tRNA synthetase, class [Actinomycetota bacterium]|nr:lysyl-tRNA synthetase, class [Actinomycetota bacterium]
MAWVVRAVALLAVLGMPHPEDGGYPSGKLDPLLDGTAFAATMLSAGTMLVLAGALSRRKERAWVLMLVVVAIGTVANCQVRRWWVAALNVAVLVLLLWARHDFHARSERGSQMAALRLLAVMGPFSVIAGMLITVRLAPHDQTDDRLVEVLLGLLGFAPDIEIGRTTGCTALQVALNTLGGLTALLVFVVALAPVRKTSRLSAVDEDRLRDLLTRFGERDSLGYFALRGDKTAIFSPSAKAAVVYRVVGGVSLASGDPVGDPGDWPGAIDTWLRETVEYGWTPGVIGASEDGAIAYQRAGLDSLEVGDEAVLDLGTFTLQGRRMRVVRQAVNRVRRAGCTLDVRRQRDLPHEELPELLAVTHSLRTEDVERGFSMALGRLGSPRDPDLVLVRARDAEGRLVAVLSFVPWGSDGLSLDVMRRSRDSENGTLEFMVCSLAEMASDLGIRRISLNFAVFRSVFERGSRVGAGPVLRLWHRTLVLASRWWQIESLYRANAKYAPLWVPRFLCFKRAAELPRVAVAALEAEAFLQRPGLRLLDR